MSSTSATARAGLPRGSSVGELGMWVFLASEALFFGVLFFAYVMARLHHPDAFASASRHTDLLLGSLNTGILLTSSLTMAFAARSAQSRDWVPCRYLLLATFLLGATFLAIKCWEYHQDFQQHLLPGAHFALHGADEPGLGQFFLVYFASTGAHAVHLIIGLGLVAALTAKVAWRATRHLARTIEIVGLYWHLVDIVWIFLFPLLYLVARA